MTNTDIAALVQQNVALSQTQAAAASAAVSRDWAKHIAKTQSLLERLQAGEVDVAGILAMDKMAIRNVSDADFQFACDVMHAASHNASTSHDPIYVAQAVMQREVTRRKAIATKAARAAEQAAREANGATFQAGEKVEVHAFGHWYPGEVVRTTRTGSVVARYTSGTGVTREKTVGAEKVRKLQK